MYFKTAYDLLLSGKKIRHFGTEYEYLWYDPDKRKAMMHFQNGEDKEVNYSLLVKYDEEKSNKWELVD